MNSETVPVPRVSVIIPAYNAARHLAPTLRSALAQTEPLIEIVVVDDGSTDATPDILRSFGDRIRAFRQENRGVSAARNRAIAEARGEWIAFLDSDDLWAPQKLERQLAVADAHPEAGLIYCLNRFVDDGGTPIADYSRKIPVRRGDALIDLFCEFFLLTSAVMIRRDLTAKTGGFNESLRVGEDYDFFLRALQQTRIEIVEEPLLDRRVHAASLSRQDFVLDGKSDLKSLYGFLERYPVLLQRDPKRVRGRLAEYHFQFGYHCLENGLNGLAFEQFKAALRYEQSPRIFKNLLLCGLPAGLRRRLKGPAGAVKH